MVLYSVYHGGALSVAIVHRMTNHKDEEATLIIGNTGWHIGNTFDTSGMLKIFNKVVGMSLTYNVNNMQETFDKYEKIFNENDVELLEYDRIYSLFDYDDPLGNFLNYKQIKYCVIEQYKNHMKINYKKNQEMTYEKIVDFHFITNKYKVVDYENNDLLSIIKFEKLNYPNVIFDLTDEQQKIIIESYGIEDNEKKIDALLLCSSLYESRNGMMNELMREYFHKNSESEEAEASYYFAHSILLDVFIDAKNIVIKPHPSRKKVLKENDIELFSSYFPVEFIPFLKNVSIDSIYGFGSGSINNLAKIKGIESVVALNNIFYRYTYQFLKVFSAIEVSVDMGKSVIGSDSMNETFIKSVVENINIGNNSLIAYSDNNDEIEVVFMDVSKYSECEYDSRLKNKFIAMQDNQILICLDSDKNQRMIKNYYINNCAILRLIKFNIREIFEGNLDDEYLYCFSKNSSIIQNLSKYEFIRKLKHTGIELQLKALSREEIICERIKLDMEKILEKYDSKILKIENSIHNMKVEMKKNDNSNNLNERAIMMLLENKIGEKNIENENLSQQIHNELEKK